MTHEADPKDVYEISKITSTPRQIMDDFTQSIAMTMFREYIASFKEPELAIRTYMDVWEKNIIQQKEMELKALASRQDTMTDMVVGASIVNSSDLQEFIDEVVDFKDMVTDNVVAAMNPDEDE